MPGPRSPTATSDCAPPTAEVSSRIGFFARSEHARKTEAFRSGKPSRPGSSPYAVGPNDDRFVRRHHVGLLRLRIDRVGNDVEERRERERTLVETRMRNDEPG